MPKTATVPDVLSGHAAEIWQSTFLSAYDGTCKDEGERKDECAARVAWSAVKEKYKKDKDSGEWVAKANMEEQDTYHLPISGADGQIPTPSGLPEEAREIFEMAFEDALRMECTEAADPRKCAIQKAWAKVNEKYYKTDNDEYVQRTSVFSEFIGKSLAEDFGMKITDPLAFQQRREFGRQKRKTLAKEGKALPWGGYPIENCTDVKNAVQAIGRAKDRSRTIAHIKKHAKRLGCTHFVPKKWRDEGSAEEKSVAAMEEKKYLDDENRLAMAAKSAGIDYNALLKRRSVRAKEAAEDQAMLEAGYGDTLARRTDDISSNEWANLPVEQRTVGAVIWRRHCLRKYDEAVENAILRGWKAEKNKFRPAEWIFKTWVDTPDGWQLVRAVMVRRHGEDEWRMKEISRGASLSVAIRVGPDEVRR